ncbi:MAG: LysR family transcriptional regulator [Burkholderiaceae bacterium]
MRFSLRQLHIFESVARHLSYTRAAEELHLTQPAVFAQVKQLEDSVGLQLIERIGKQLFLTTAGHEVLVTSRETVSAIERLEMRLSDMQGLKKWAFARRHGHNSKVFDSPFIGRILLEISRNRGIFDSYQS